MIFLNHVITQNTPTYGNSGEIRIEQTRQIRLGDTSNECKLSFGNHIGTHVDAPYHFDENGKKLEDYPADFWICNYPSLISVDFEPEQEIALDDLLPFLNNLNPQTDCLLLKTNFERFRKQPEIYCFKNPSISFETAIYLRKSFHLKFFGVDYISIGSKLRREMGRKTHKAFLCSKYEQELKLNDPILLIEDMKLSSLHETPKKIWIAPLYFENSDGAPVTILAETTKMSV